MKGLRVVYMGTPEFAVAGLKAIVNSTHQVVGVVTVADKKSGRGKKINSSAIKKYQQEYLSETPIFQPTNLKDENFISDLKKLNADVFVIVAFRMLPKVVWQIPKHKTFNLHASLLPSYRGAAPINWAIINKEKKTGVTTFFIDEKIDTGDIIFQEEIDIQKNETAGELHDRLMALGANVIVNTLDAIAHENIELQPQNKDIKFNEAPKLNPDNCKVNWKQEAIDIHHHILGMSPYPAAYCYITIGGKDLKVKIIKTELTKLEHRQDDIFSFVVESKKLYLYLGDKYLNLKEIHIENKRKMNEKDIINGYNPIEWELKQ